MMHFYKELYLSPGVKNVSGIKRKLKTGRGSLDLYVLTLNDEGKRLEFFHNGILKQKVLHDMDINVVGLASGRDECVKLVERIVNEAYEATGTYDAYEYLRGDR